jgi:hypothetical protein
MTLRLEPTPGSPGITTELPLDRDEAIKTAAGILAAAGVAEFTVKDGRYWGR